MDGFVFHPEMLDRLAEDFYDGDSIAEYLEPGFGFYPDDEGTPADVLLRTAVDGGTAITGPEGAGIYLDYSPGRYGDGPHATFVVTVEYVGADGGKHRLSLMAGGGDYPEDITDERLRGREAVADYLTSAVAFANSALESLREYGARA